MSLNLDTQITEDDIKAAEAASSSFALVPKGTYHGTISKAEVKTYEKGNYAGKHYLNITLRIAENSEVGAKRTFFYKVPLFGRWNPSAKHPAGYPTKAVIALGKGLPGPAEIQGKPISFYLTVKDADDYHTEQWNDVSSVSAFKGSTPSAVKDIAGDVWNTPAAAAPAGDVWATTAPADPALAAAAASGKTY
jgi:hypothetical protein